MGKSKDNITDKPITGTIENSNINILNNIDNYLQYLRDNIKQIIIDDELKYSDPMEKKKTYPDFTYTQFLYLLSRLYDRVFSVNLELLCDYNHINNINTHNYNMDKVKLCYMVYCRLCQYYGYNCSIDPFYSMTGIDERTFKEWLSVGKSDLFNIMVNNAKSGVIARFENSKNPLLSLASANYKYNINTPTNERTEAAAVEVLPDLLSIEDHQKGLQELPKQD